ncbi:hypothetical protein GCK72_020411 [Caenorhabditis remanei]|uniref:F-box domain-containing protein n=1 Tax=Caenorhabditis remanei TaxID=31234 RepID=A0A6A5GGH5_CAERE|nr:hypothetical protein GCK72_020411 [Caenorhabditis remanei]KAF1753854.1 hypothetical protein GCK72_020411 [Caenorhabditis remanei]
MSLSKFPILKLPTVALNEVLKLFTPFEIIFFSFCSKRTKSICQSIRTVPKCKVALYNFSVWIDSVYAIYLQFTYFPSELWVFNLEACPESKHTKRNKFWSVLPNGFLKMCYSRKPTKSSCQKKTEPIEGIHFPNWNPAVDTVETYAWLTNETTLTTRHSSHLYTSENLASVTRKLADYISEIFHDEENLFALEWNRYNGKQNRITMDLFCNPVQDFLLTGDTSNDSSKNDMLTYILKNQNSKRTMTLWINPSLDFSFDFGQFKNSLEVLHITYSHWITFQNILDADFKLLIDKWRDGWTPNWKTMSIELNEDIDVDTCVEDLEPEHYKSKKVVCGNYPIQLNRFKGYFDISCETTFMHGYHILRSDGMIATIGISVDKYRVGWFHIRK